MTGHTHREVVDGCYRCELGKDEARDALIEQRAYDEGYRDALREAAERLRYALVHGGPPFMDEPWDVIGWLRAEAVGDE